MGLVHASWAPIPGAMKVGCLGWSGGAVGWGEGAQRRSRGPAAAAERTHAAEQSVGGSLT